jgi:hypothetical protein
MLELALIKGISPRKCKRGQGLNLEKPRKIREIPPSGPDCGRFLAGKRGLGPSETECRTLLDWIETAAQPG